RTVYESMGLPRAGYDFSDGSGMSTYNRMSPRAAVALLRWTAGQPWGAEYRASLPVGGVDGTLRRRFAGTPLAGKIFAKTGTLNATNALSGWLIAASGRELTFSIIANDVPDGASALAAMDQALLAIAAQN
ncbi:MAG: D-alanyl-D-alanine carboxypeptidase, partial [Novosphingobium sp.]